MAAFSFIKKNWKLMGNGGGTEGVWVEKRGFWIADWDVKKVFFYL